MEDPKAVFVSNISPSATEKTVSDFFSFCGRITHLTLRKTAIDPSGVQEAVVVFETDSAAKTALLLTNALIVDRPITVVSYFPSQIEVDASAPPVAEKPYNVPDSESTKTSVMASLLAAGYVLGSDAINKAKSVDEQHKISQQFKVGAEQIKIKANELDKTLHISETANTIKTGVVDKVKEVDEKLHISEKVGAVATAAKQQATALAAKANENEVIQKGVGALKSVGTSIQTTFQSFRDETSKAIDEKILEKEGQPGAGVPTSAPTGPEEVAVVETTVEVSPSEEVVTTEAIISPTTPSVQ